jgi:hypothetical protein
MLPVAKRILRGIVKVVAMVCRLRIVTPTAKLVSNLHSKKRSILTRLTESPLIAWLSWDLNL